MSNESLALPHIFLDIAVVDNIQNMMQKQILNIRPYFEQKHSLQYITEEPRSIMLTKLNLS